MYLTVDVPAGQTIPPDQGFGIKQDVKYEGAQEVIDPAKFNSKYQLWKLKPTGTTAADKNMYTIINAAFPDRVLQPINLADAGAPIVLAGWRPRQADYQMRGRLRVRLLDRLYLRHQILYHPTVCPNKATELQCSLLRKHLIGKIPTKPLQVVLYFPYHLQGKYSMIINTTRRNKFAINLVDIRLANLWQVKRKRLTPLPNEMYVHTKDEKLITAR